MNIPNTPSRRILLALGCLAAIATGARGQLVTGTADPTGIRQIQMQAQSDTVVSLGLTRPPEMSGTVQAAAAGVITVSGTPAWTPGQWVYASGTQNKTYYALLGAVASGSNPLEGRIYAVTANGSNTLTLATNGDDVGTVPAGALITLYPYWTLGTLLPAGEAGSSFYASGSPLAPQTEVFLTGTGVGINLPISAAYYFYNGSWRQINHSTSEDHQDDLLPPFVSLIFRNNSNASSTLNYTGCVPTRTLTIPLATNAAGPQDNYLAVPRPAGVTLNNSGLITSGAFAASASPLNRSDELYVYDNSSPGMNKAISAAYYYYNGAWRKVGQSVTIDAGGDSLQPTAIIIRKKQGNGQPLTWQNPSPY